MENRHLRRGKRVDNGEWVVGFYLNPLEEYGNGERVAEIVPLEAIQNFECVSPTLIVDPTTICQCTGLKDKNGRLIWENDIVAYWDSYSTENGQAEADCDGKVVWDDETISFQVTNRLSAESYEVLDECSVIGNVFDNPELLEGSHDGE